MKVCAFQNAPENASVSEAADNVSDENILWWVFQFGDCCTPES
jgi:hypothetical protein